MGSPYQDFVRKAKERFEERRKVNASGKGQYQFTLHAQHKMQQYGLSEQRVKSVIRNPKRREEGIVPKTVAVMQPVSIKKAEGKETWKQEIWVMFIIRNQQQKKNAQPSLPTRYPLPATSLRIISAWRYPGVSPKRNPIPAEILREIEEGNIIGEGEDVYF
ncbi:MAG: DUF4258 domain-containing protein [Candidatus Moraniibacteriota bacterium]